MNATTTATQDALATARVRLRDEINAIRILEGLGHGNSQDAKFAWREAKHYQALIARLELKLANETNPIQSTTELAETDGAYWFDVVLADGREIRMSVPKNEAR